MQLKGGVSERGGVGGGRWRMGGGVVGPLGRFSFCLAAFSI